MPKVLGNLDLNKNELQNSVLQPLSSPPSNPKAGLQYFDTLKDTAFYYDGTEWVPLRGTNPWVDTITTTTTWVSDGPYYTQVVTLDSGDYTITGNSKVDIQPEATAINQLLLDGVQAIYISNTSGVLTMYAIGASPSAALTLQVTVTEVDLA